MKPEQQGHTDRTWLEALPFGLLLLGLLSLIAGLVTAQTGRAILQIAVVGLALSWLAMRALSRTKRPAR